MILFKIDANQRWVWIGPWIHTRTHQVTVPLLDILRGQNDREFAQSIAIQAFEDLTK